MCGTRAGGASRARMTDDRRTLCYRSSSVLCLRRLINNSGRACYLLTMPDLLLELFSEEIPARMQARAAEDLRKLVTDRLVAAGLVYEGAKAFVDAAPARARGAGRAGRSSPT